MRALFLIVMTAFLMVTSANALVMVLPTEATTIERQVVDVSGTFGLAMHGQPKYGPEATHLDYAHPDAPKGGALKIAAIGSFDTLNPFSIKGKSAQGLNLVYDRLMARVWDEPFTMYPLIAERVEVPDDRSSMTVHINPKAKFQDGTPITADDVIFSLNTLREKGRPNMRRVYGLVEQTERLGPLRVRFNLSDGHDQETVMILALMPVLSKAWWEDRNFDATLLEAPNTNGPYRISKIDPGRSIPYKRNPDYWAADLLTNVGHHNIDELTYDYYRDNTVAFEAFKAGALDLRREFDAGQWASAYDFPALQSGEVIQEALPHQRPERVRGFIFNTRRAPFDDQRVRKALNLLFDFKWVNENLFHSQYQRINSTFPNSPLAATGTPGEAELELLNPWRDDLSPEVFGEAYQPPATANRQEQRKNQRAANDLLNDAGWGVVDGQRMKNGKPLSFEVLLTGAEDEKLALALIRNFEKMGVQVQIRVIDSASFQRRLGDYDFDIVLHHWQNSLSPGTEQSLYWSCNAAETPSSFNYSGVCDPAIDDLVNKVAQAQDYDALKAAAQSLDRVLMHKELMIPLFFIGKDFVAYQNRIHHPQTIPLYGMVIETWWIEDLD